MSSKVLSSSAASRLASTTCSRCRRALSTTVLTDQEKQEALNKLKSASPSFAQWQEVRRNFLDREYRRGVSDASSVTVIYRGRTLSPNISTFYPTFLHTFPFHSLIRFRIGMLFQKHISLLILTKPGGSCHRLPCWPKRWIIILNGPMCTIPYPSP